MMEILAQTISAIQILENVLTLEYLAEIQTDVQKIIATLKLVVFICKLIVMIRILALKIVAILYLVASTKRKIFVMEMHAQKIGVIQTLEKFIISTSNVMTRIHVL
jgi:hypothetical protein